MSNTAISSAGMRIIKLLIGNPPQTVPDLMRTSGVTRTAVAEQLGELMADGYVEREEQPLNGRGRPRHVYRATQAALMLLNPKNQQLMVPAMWRAIRDLGGEEMTRKVLGKVSRCLADHYNGRITAKKPLERLRQLIALLIAEGVLIDAIENDGGHIIVYKRSCPFISMIDEHQTVCHIDQEMMSAVVGGKICRIDCRHQGAPCCTFKIAKE